MLAIRLQRLGRKAYPVYRVAVQEAQRHPTSGRVVAYVGAYNPHTKDVKLDKEKIEFYLKHGAQPSPRVVRLLEAEKVSLPAWVQKPRTDKASKLRNPEKLRKNKPQEPKAEAPAAESPTTEESTAEESPAEAAEKTEA